MATLPVYPLESYPGEPEKLPYPVRDSASFKYRQSFVSLGMDDGHTRQRRKWDAQPLQFTMQWNLSWNQLAWFEAFLKWDCARASGQFTMAAYPGAPQRTYRFTAYPHIAFNDSSGAWELTGDMEVIQAAPAGFAASPSSLPQWPVSLPQPEQNGYTIDRAGTVSRSSITAGLANQRNRFQYEIAAVAVTFILDEAQKLVFDDFVNNQLLGGLAPFIGYFANGTGSSLQKMMFTDTPTIAQNGACYTVTGTMEIADPPSISEFNYRGLGKLTLSETITYVDSIAIRDNHGIADLFEYQDVVTLAFGKNLTESIGYSDSVSLLLNIKRTLAENVLFADSVSIKSFRGLADSISYSDSGNVAMNNYCVSDYVQFGYTADSVATF